MMHSPYFRFPLFLTSFSPSKISFHPPNYLMTLLLVVGSKFKTSLYLRKKYTFPLFRKFVISPILLHFPSISFDLCAFGLIYVILIHPYFDDDAFMHHAMHVGL